MDVIKLQNDDEAAKDLIRGGAEIAGTAVGTALGLFGGPATAVGGAALGAAVGKVVSRVGSDLYRRLLGSREVVRVGAAAAFASAAIVTRLENGMTLRDDGFFSSQMDRRSKSDEILEGVLLKVRDMYEEKKLPYVANLYVNVCFRSEISTGYAHHLLRLADRLTYRQLVALSIASDPDSRRRLRNQNFHNEAASQLKFAHDSISLMIELFDLYQLGLVANAVGTAWLEVTDIVPRDVKTEGVGSMLVEILELEKVPEQDRNEWYSAFPKTD